jgi:uncharacterized membrane protein YjjB (DUF3815 family)
LEKVQTEYVTFLGAHDWLHHDYLSKLVSLLEGNPKCVLAYPRIIKVKPSGYIMQGISGDTVNTAGLSLRMSIEMMVGSLRYFSMMFGVFRTSTLRRCRFGYVYYGCDQVLLFKF